MCSAPIPHCTRHSPHSPVWTRFRSCRGRSSVPKARGLAWTRSRILHGGHNSSGWKSISSGASGTAGSKFCWGFYVRVVHVDSQPAYGLRATEIVSNQRVRRILQQCARRRHSVHPDTRSSATATTRHSGASRVEVPCKINPIAPLLFPPTLPDDEQSIVGRARKTHQANRLRKRGRSWTGLACFFASGPHFLQSRGSGSSPARAYPALNVRKVPTSDIRHRIAAPR